MVSGSHHSRRRFRSVVFIADWKGSFLRHAEHLDIPAGVGPVPSLSLPYQVGKPLHEFVGECPGSISSCILPIEICVLICHGVASGAPKRLEVHRAVGPKNVADGVNAHPPEHPARRDSGNDAKALVTTLVQFVNHLEDAHRPPNSRVRRGDARLGNHHRQGPFYNRESVTRRAGAWKGQDRPVTPPSPCGVRTRHAADLSGWNRPSQREYAARSRARQTHRGCRPHRSRGLDKHPERHRCLTQTLPGEDLPVSPDRPPNASSQR